MAALPNILNVCLQSRPESAGLVRTILTSIAGPCGLRGQVLDDLKTALSEACNNAVEHAYRGQSGPIAVRLDVAPAAVAATVRDWGSGFQDLAPSPRGMRVGLPLINVLADRAEFLSASGGGTEVRMGFELPHDSGREELVERLERSDRLLEAWAPSRQGLAGELVVTLLPAELLARVLAPLTSAFAARARFGLEHLSAVYLAASGILERVAAASRSSRVSFALTGDQHRLELTIGPVRAGASELLRGPASAGTVAGPPDGWVGEFGCEAIDEAEMLRVVLANQERGLSGAER